MTQDVEVSVQHIPNGGINAQNIAALGATLGAHGLESNQVQALVARMQQIGVQTALAALPELMEDIRRMQSARVYGAIQKISTLSSMGGYIRRDHVLLILNSLVPQNPQ